MAKKERRRQKRKKRKAKNGYIWAKIGVVKVTSPLVKESDIMIITNYIRAAEEWWSIVRSTLKTRKIEYVESQSYEMEDKDGVLDTVKNFVWFSEDGGELGKSITKIMEGDFKEINI